MIDLTSMDPLEKINSRDRPEASNAWNATEVIDFEWETSGRGSRRCKRVSSVAGVRSVKSQS